MIVSSSCPAMRMKSERSNGECQIENQTAEPKLAAPGHLCVTHKAFERIMQSGMKPAQARASCFLPKRYRANTKCGVNCNDYCEVIRVTLIACMVKTYHLRLRL